MTHVRFSKILKEYLEFNNITIKEFASRIGITSKHLIDILNGNVELSPYIIVAISIVTSIPADYILKIEENYKLEEQIYKFINDNNITLNEYLKRFMYKELIKRDWINFTYKENKIDVLLDIMKYLRVSNPYNLYKIDKNIFYKSNNDKQESLLLWLERCYRLSKNQIVKEYDKDNIDILVNYIRDNAYNNIFDEDKLIKQFNDNGIILVIEDDLPGSKIRGAFKVNNKVPAIYLTRKYKRIADIYFALLHELAHCKTDYNKAKSTNLVSYIDVNEIEDKADKNALNWMVDNEYYNLVIKNKNYIQDKYPMSFLVYRLAKDNIIKYNSDIYQKYNIMININNN